jgi:hypothetical protein
MSDQSDLEKFTLDEISRLQKLKKEVTQGAFSENIVSKVSPDNPIRKGKVIGQTDQGYDIIEPQN